MLKFHNGIDHNVGIQNLPEILEASASSSDGTNSSRKLPFWSKIFMESSSTGLCISTVP